MSAWAACSCACGLAAAAPRPLAAPPAQSAQDAIAPPSFDREVRPLLAARCLPCHGPDAGARKARLRLDVRDEAIAAGAVQPGDPAASELVRRITSDDPEVRMPPRDNGPPLAAAERALLVRWIAAGAVYEPHWAFVPPRRPALPATAAGEEPVHPVDAFVGAALRARGLEPSPPADRATLARRLALDLTGLPPTPEATAAFAGDPAPDAWSDLVARTLASPHHGEHMALPWLDAARYADSNGYQHDGDRQAWPWRDWLVRALQANRPLDELVVEMLAGDLLPEPTRDQLVATAFLRHHPVNNEGGAIPEEVRFNYVVDRVHTVATVFLGLTLGCAQCHDHKYDPCTQRDYYRLFAFFDNVDEDGKVASSRRHTYHEFQVAEPSLTLSDPELDRALRRARAELEAARTRWRTVEPAVNAALSTWLAGATDTDLRAVPEAIAAAVRKKRQGPLVAREQRAVRTHFACTVSGNAEWADAVAALDRAERALGVLHERLAVVMVMRDRAERRPTRVHARGAYDQPVGEVLQPGVPAALGTLSARGAVADRLDLARWIVARDNPLFARVMVDRLWQALFGRGLVATPEDFGTAGARPTHPELLDWLAVELIESGFDLQHVLRLIVTSATYRQASTVRPSDLLSDPAGVWLGRSPRPRLSSFVLRDQALSVAGLLDRRIGGPPVFPGQPPGLWLDVSFEVFDYPAAPSDERHRRSLYTFWRRTIAPPELFDSANRQTCVVRPSRTNTPLHALVLLDAPVFVEAARGLAERVCSERSDQDDRLQRLFALATGRLPHDAELRVLRRSLAQHRDHYRAATDDARALVAAGGAAADPGTACAELAAWMVLAQSVLNLDEVLCRP